MKAKLKNEMKWNTIDEHETNKIHTKTFAYTYANKSFKLRLKKIEDKNMVWKRMNDIGLMLL